MDVEVCQSLGQACQSLIQDNILQNRVVKLSKFVKKIRKSIDNFWFFG